MNTMERITITLTPEMAQTVRGAVEAGEYACAAPRAGSSTTPCASTWSARTCGSIVMKKRGRPLAELDARQLVDGDEVLAWIDSWGSENEREPPR